VPRYVVAPTLATLGRGFRRRDEQALQIKSHSPTVLFGVIRYTRVLSLLGRDSDVIRSVKCSAEKATTFRPCQSNERRLREQRHNSTMRTRLRVLADRYNAFIARHEIAWELTMSAFAALFVVSGFTLDATADAGGARWRRHRTNGALRLPR
jgi:hypothetical protein